MSLDNVLPMSLDNSVTYVPDRSHTYFRKGGGSPTLLVAKRARAMKPYPCPYLASSTTAEQRAIFPAGSEMRASKDLVPPVGRLSTYSSSLSITEPDESKPVATILA